MYLNGHILVEIEGKQLETCTEIEISNDAAQLGSDCTITVPLTVRIKNEDQYLIDNVRNLFTKGNFIQIWAWYTEYETTPGRQLVFEGFIWDFLEGTPMKIRCVDYAYSLRNENINLSYPKGSKPQLSKVIKDILSGTDITLKLPYADADTQGFTFPNMSRAAAIEQVREQCKWLVFTLIGEELYMNIASNTLNEVKLQSDINVIDFKAQKPDAAFQDYKVQVSMKKANGTKEIVEVTNANGADGRLREMKLFNIPVTAKGAEIYGKQALEKLQLGHYKGKMECYLYPEISLFDAIKYTDIRYPERSATYSVQSTVLTLNKDGFHRELTLGYLTA
jgi:hypothetical protein